MIKQGLTMLNVFSDKQWDQARKLLSRNEKSWFINQMIKYNRQEYFKVEYKSIKYMTRKELYNHLEPVIFRYIYIRLRTRGNGKNWIKGGN